MLNDAVTISNCSHAQDYAATQLHSQHLRLVSPILSGASQQLRNSALPGRPLLQPTALLYLHDLTPPRNTPQPGSGCSAINGITRTHAILGPSEPCIATHPSNMC